MAPGQGVGQPQQQFRYTQTPSKVLHLRNLPWECTEEELVVLCKPFGRIVNTMCNVGANKNQAFVEFALIQYMDTETAATARNALDGRSIPRLQIFPCFDVDSNVAA